MDYSNPNYRSTGQQDSYGNASQSKDRYYVHETIELTPQEKKVVRECSKEGIMKRGIPMAVAFGLAGLAGARAGPLNSSRFGAKPAVLILGTVGYFLGRFSYSKVCMQRVLEVPDGNFRKLMAQKGVVFRENPEYFNQQDSSNFYSTIDVPKEDQDQAWDAKKVNSDIEMSGTSSFDTVPSDYYAKVEDQPIDEIKSKSYTSYDDLRRRNRDEFNTKLYPDYGPPRYRNVESTKPRVAEAPPVNQTGNRQTKYGDSWE